MLFAWSSLGYSYTLPCITVSPKLCNYLQRISEVRVCHFNNECKTSMCYVLCAGMCAVPDRRSVIGCCWSQFSDQRLSCRSEQHRGNMSRNDHDEECKESWALSGLPRRLNLSNWNYSWLLWTQHYTDRHHGVWEIKVTQRIQETCQWGNRMVPVKRSYDQQLNKNSRKKS